MDFDEVLSLLGELGRYQKWLLLFVAFPASLPTAVNTFDHIFISDVPEHHCHAPISDEKASLLRTKLAPSEDYREALQTLFLPRDAYGKFSRCQQYDIDLNSAITQVVKEDKDINSSTIEDFVARNRWPSVRCVHGWDYDTSVYPETLASKFNVVCEDQWLVSTAQGVFFLGGVIGSVIFGWISDRWGRRPALLLSTALMTSGNLAGFFIPNYGTYMILKFIVGLSHPCVYNTAFVIATEMCGKGRRMTSTIVCDLSYATAIMLFAIVSYFVRHWRTLIATTWTPMLLFIAYYWLVPESPQWLISQGRVDEAEVIVQKIAKVNRVRIEPDFLRKNLAHDLLSIKSGRQDSNKVGVAQLIKYPRVTLKLILMIIVWSIITLTCNSLSFAAPIMPSDTSVAFFLSGLCEVPGIFLAFTAIQYFGRRSTLLVTLFLSGVLSMTTALVPDEYPWLGVLLPSLAKLVISIPFSVIYLYTGEVFPTVLRGFAFGACATGSQTSMIASPYILFLSTIYGNHAPFIVFGVAAMLALLPMLALPETRGAPLPTTMDESENYADFVKRATNVGAADKRGAVPDTSRVETRKEGSTMQLSGRNLSSGPAT
ncbi:solute carrier family 22 member 5 [Galendromus occidentalis]|uniref:Solute carrier family 22 member 5 n=1 Tax=Galendromus occidentalis TaxID=34638 RepID=A0AAJ7SFX1_9ACAR|nr:solute carrier family 22 member 5 [Galendromus occidentalis]